MAVMAPFFRLAGAGMLPREPLALALSLSGQALRLFFVSCSARFSTQGWIWQRATQPCELAHLSQPTTPRQEETARPSPDPTPASD
jgi:hypothetical protein